MQTELKLAVLLPCYNEGKAIFKVVQDFKRVLPSAEVYVYDNNSTDDTIIEAEQAGAIVRKEFTQGKGAVVRRMFSDIEADIYIMADGDGTYDVASTPTLIQCLLEGPFDMVVGTRADNQAAYRQGHALGNKVFNYLLKSAFNSHFTDIFSGFRVFSRRFVKSFPALSLGFDIETELSIHTLEIGIPSAELPTPFHERALGTESKLSTFKDGFRVLFRMVFLFKEVKPFVFFACIALLLAGLSLGLGLPIVEEYVRTQWVHRVPTAILALGLMILSFIHLTSGFILSSLSHARKENKRLSYLRYPSCTLSHTSRQIIQIQNREKAECPE